MKPSLPQAILEFTALGEQTLRVDEAVLDLRDTASRASSTWFDPDLTTQELAEAVMAIHASNA